MKFHIVQVNEKIKDISRKYNVSVDEIIKLNRHINNIEHIVPGMKLRLPILSDDVNDQLKENFLEIEKYYPKLEDFKEAKIEKKDSNSVIYEEEIDDQDYSEDESTTINVIPQNSPVQSSQQQDTQSLHPLYQQNNPQQMPYSYNQPQNIPQQSYPYPQGMMPPQQMPYPYPQQGAYPQMNPYQPTYNYQRDEQPTQPIGSTKGQKMDPIPHKPYPYNEEIEQPKRQVQETKTYEGYPSINQPFYYQQQVSQVPPQNAFKTVEEEYDEHVKEIKADLREFVKHTKIRKKDPLDLL